MEPDVHTKHLGSMVAAEKAFRVPSTARTAKLEMALDMKHTQADQGSDMNVASPSLVRLIQTPFRPLSEIGFRGLSMQTADHRETMLEYWCEFDLCCEGIWRNVRCFVSVIQPGAPDPPRLLLGLPWLYSVNAIICIRDSSIQIGDPAIGEKVRFITGPELVYHRDHSMLMYPKAIIYSADAFDNQEESEEEDESSEDDLSEVEDEAPQGFR